MRGKNRIYETSTLKKEKNTQRVKNKATLRTGPIGYPAPGLTNSVELLRRGGSQSESVEAVDTHALHVAIAREVETNHHDQIGENEDGAFEVVAFSFAVYVRQEEYA